MELQKLGEYKYWVDQSPQEILNAVKSHGGWAKVFPKGLPLWAHRVRNWFNVEPISLTRMDQGTAREFLAIVDFGLDALERKLNRIQGNWSRLAEIKALSGDVYKDQSKTIWFQMDAGGTIYHWGDKPIVTLVEGPYASFNGQEAMPIFKLVSVDGTGGSKETIIQNWLNIPVRYGLGGIAYRGRANIGKVNSPEYISYLVEQKPKYQGSYNYAETVDSGFAAHEKYDVNTHEKRPNVYFDPPNRFQLLSKRRFPEKDDRGVQLASQDQFI